MPAAHTAPPRLVIVAETSLFAQLHAWRVRSELLLQAIAGEPRFALQLRGRNLTPEKRRACFEPLIARAADLEARVFVNEPDIRSAPANHLEWHLPERSMAALRDSKATRKPAAIAVHDLESAQAAAALGARWVQFGPVHDPGSKPAKGVGLNRLREFVDAIDTPCIAVGGIDPDRASGILAAGAVGIAVASALMKAQDPRRELQRFAAILL